MAVTAPAREAAAMRVHRIDHVSLDVHDRARTLDWYAQVLGLRGSLEGAAPEEPVFLGPPGARLGLFQERPPGLRHIALATDAAGQRLVAERLDRLAIPFRPERHRSYDSIYVADPDGTTLEIIVARD
jgi:catechol 2,3-dioxygenase-like lactoylglutathione lyase family enzyme